MTEVANAYATGTGASTALSTPATIETANVLSILNRVITDPNLPMERVNQAFDFYERMEKRNAKIAFDHAMAKARSEIKPIKKSKPVTFGNAGGTAYSHETLADIANEVDPILSRFGLSYRYRTSVADKIITVTCIVTHEQGHCEENSLPGPADATGSKNAIQAIGSTVTYLQRYTLKASLGLSAAQDDDGNGGEKPRKSSAQSKRDGTDKKFNEIKLDFETATSLDHLKHLGESWSEEIAEMPSKWSDLLRDTYEDKASEFRARAS